MKKWVGTTVLVVAVAAVGLAARQIVQDLSDNAELWKSVTDEPGRA